jgi:hypothetical protein
MDYFAVSQNVGFWHVASLGGDAILVAFGVKADMVTVPLDVRE